MTTSEAAMTRPKRRYCEQEHRAKGGKYRVKFVGRVS